KFEPMLYLKQGLILIFLLSMIGLSCKNKLQEKDENEPLSGPGYFSINQYIQDHWSTYEGQPFSIDYVKRKDGHSDTTHTNAYEVNWGKIIQSFVQTDIGDLKYVGHYNFENFVDSPTSTCVFIYTAIESTLKTRKLMITTDMFSSKILNLFIEWQDEGNMKSVYKKLFYSPIHLINITTDIRKAIGKDESINESYIFLVGIK